MVLKSNMLAIIIRPPLEWTAIFTTALKKLYHCSLFFPQKQDHFLLVSRYCSKISRFSLMSSSAVTKLQRSIPWLLFPTHLIQYLEIHTENGDETWNTSIVQHKRVLLVFFIKAMWSKFYVKPLIFLGELPLRKVYKNVSSNVSRVFLPKHQKQRYP